TFPGTFPPWTVSVRRDGTMLIAFTDALRSIGPDLKIESVVEDPDWVDSWSIHSSSLSPDERKLFVGGRQFVCEIDLESHKMRYLIREKALLNKLTKKEEAESRESAEMMDRMARERAAAIAVEIKSADLKTCPDGHATLIDVPISYGLPGGDMEEL